MIRPFCSRYPGRGVACAIFSYVSASKLVECIYRLSLPPSVFLSSSTFYRRCQFPFPSVSVCVARSASFRASLHLHPSLFLPRPSLPLLSSLSTFPRPAHSCLSLSICQRNGVSIISLLPSSCRKRERMSAPSLPVLGKILASINSARGNARTESNVRMLKKIKRDVKL